MTDTFQDISREIIRGFRDAILGTVNIFKMDAAVETNEKKGTEQMTVLAQRRAHKQQQIHKEEKDR